MITRDVGLEIEYSERCKHSLDKPDGWIRGYDGSVKGKGVELRLEGKKSGESLDYALINLNRFFEKNSEYVHTDKVGAGYHCHIDFSNKEKQREAFLTFADSLYCWVNKAVAKCRMRSGFCEKEPKAEVTIIRSNTLSLEYGSHDPFASHYYWVSRSSRLPTVEIRLHHSTQNIMKIFTWADFWSNLAIMHESYAMYKAESLADLRKIYHRVSPLLHTATKSRFGDALALVKRFRA